MPKPTLPTATNTPAKMTDGTRSHYKLRDGSNVMVRYNEAKVSFPIVSVGDATQQGNWFVFGPGGQAMIGQDHDEDLRRIVGSSKVVQLKKRCGVYWLPCVRNTATDSSAPLCAILRTAVVQEAHTASE